MRQYACVCVHAYASTCVFSSPLRPPQRGPSVGLCGGEGPGPLLPVHGPTGLRAVCDGLADEETQGPQGEVLCGPGQAPQRGERTHSPPVVSRALHSFYNPLCKNILLLPPLSPAEFKMVPAGKFSYTSSIKQMILCDVKARLCPQEGPWVDPAA